MNKSFLIFLMVFAVSCNNSAKNNSDSEVNLKVLSSPTDSISAEPYLFTDPNGVVQLSWIQKKKDSAYLKFSRLTDGLWSEPEVISSGKNWFVNWADYPMLISDGKGNLMAHILEKSDSGVYTYDVKLFTSSDKGETWSKPIILNEDGKKAEHGFVSMQLYGENYFVSWLDGRNSAMDSTSHENHHGQMTLRAAVVNKQGIKSDEWELDGRVCDCCQTSSALTSNGPIVVYRDRSENEIRDISIVRLINGQWTKPQSIFTDNWKIEGCPVNGPRADALNNNLAIAWFSSKENKGEVKVIFSKDGGSSFMQPIRIDGGEAIGRVDLVMLDDNSAMVSWMEGAVIKATRVYSDGKKDTPIIISTSSSSRSSGFPQMTKSGNNILFAWSDDKEKTIKVASLAL